MTGAVIFAGIWTWVRARHWAQRNRNRHLVIPAVGDPLPGRRGGVDGLNLGP